MSSFPLPKIVYDPGTGAETLNFVYPPIQKPYLDDQEAHRADSMASAGLRQSVFERTEIIKILNMENVPWPLTNRQPGISGSGTMGTVEFFEALTLTLPERIGIDDYVFVVATVNGSGDLGGGSEPTIDAISGLAWVPIFLANSVGMWYAKATSVFSGVTIGASFPGVHYNRSLSVTHASNLPSIQVAVNSGAPPTAPNVTINGINLSIAKLTDDNWVLAVIAAPNGALIATASYLLGLYAGGLSLALGIPAPWTGGIVAGGGGSGILTRNTGLFSIAGYPTPKIVFNPGGGDVTLNFTYPNVKKPYADPLESVRNDSFSSSGIRQSMCERVDVLKNLQVENIPWTDLPNWKVFIDYAVQGGTFLYYPDASRGIAQTWELADANFSPKFSARGLSKLTLKLRLIPGGAAGFVITDVLDADLNDPTYGDTYNWQRFMQWAIQGGTFLYYDDLAASAYQTWQVQDKNWNPSFNVRGLSKFTTKLRLVPGGAFSL